LLQNAAWAYCGGGDPWAVHIHSHPATPHRRLWHALGDGDEEPHALLHDDARQHPALREMCLEALVGAVPAEWEVDPPVVSSQSQDRVSSLGSFEAEEACVVADDAPLHAVARGFSYAPGVARCLNDELGCHLVLGSEPRVGLVVERCSGLDAVKAAESLPHDAQVRGVGLPEHSSLFPCWFEEVQRQALSHGIPTGCWDARYLRLPTGISLRFHPPLKGCRLPRNDHGEVSACYLALLFARSKESF
jgi:hypothetical protein